MSASKKSKPTATAAPSQKAAPSKKAAPTKKAAEKPASTKPAAKARPAARRGDFGAPIDDFIASRAPPIRAILEKLRPLVEAAAPDAVPALKWGQPWYTIDGELMVGLGAHKAHVNVVLAGPPEAYDDPEGLLVGEGKSGRHLRLTSVDEIPVATVKRWLATAARFARG